MRDEWSWWLAAIEGEDPPIHEDEPQSGFFKCRKFSYGKWVKGPYVPARIWWERQTDETGSLVADEICRCEVDGRPTDAWRIWPWLAKKPIPLSEWEWLRAMSPLLPNKIPERSPNA